VDRFGKFLDRNQAQKVVIMPVVDQTWAGLGERSDSILASLKQRVSCDLGVEVVDEARFDRWMEEHGPGSGEYWILANGENGEVAVDLKPDITVVPVCITSKEKKSVLYHIELKILELHNAKYSKVVARTQQQPEPVPEDRSVLVAAGDSVLARWEQDLVERNGYDWPLAGVKERLDAADAALCNLECCVCALRRSVRSLATQFLRKHALPKCLKFGHLNPVDAGTAEGTRQWLSDVVGVDGTTA